MRAIGVISKDLNIIKLMRFMADITDATGAFMA